MVLRSPQDSRAFARCHPFRVIALVTLVQIVLASSVRGQEPPVAVEAAADLQPGDMVRLKIWREPDLSGDYLVDENGEVVFPKIGPVQVTRISADSLEALLVTTYSAFLRDPSVEVTPLLRVTVVGAVRNPGLYQVDRTMTILDVLALAGGVSSDGNRNKVELLRQGQELSVELSPQSQLMDSRIRSGDQLRVPERGWLARNTVLVAAALTSVAIIVAATIQY